ncbi:efflux transporter periplasmic adaptor subunit [Zobellella endophytica]|uniref:Efflux transporter periplasmic adaptor subunit n=1 Tax=Zobellella endophytica TaxID=2116700 RepID=A0A2P7R2G8_9GAMM|nr:efflux transporter periplasmic adaptor subunit [Zobellella endophytica]
MSARATVNRLEDIVVNSNSAIRNIIFASLASVLLAGCERPQAAAGAPAAPEVQVATVIHERITEWDEFTGRLQAPETVVLMPRVSGYVQQVHFREGSLVEPGEVLFQLDPAPFQAEVARLQAELQGAQTALKLADSDYRRANALRAGRAIAEEVLDARLAHKHQAAAAVASVSAALQRAELELAYTRVTAPIAGRVSYAQVTAGNHVGAGQTPLTRIVSTEEMHAYFDVDEQSYLKYATLSREGRRADAREDDNPVFMALSGEGEFDRIGRIDFVDNAVDQHTGTIRLRARFANQDGSLLPGLFARIRLAGSGSYRGVLIDDKAIGTDLNHKFVLVVDDQDRLEYRGVTLGGKVGGLRIIKAGLSPHERIVVNGLQRVRPEMTVTPTPVDMAEAGQLNGLRASQALLDQAGAGLTARAEPVRG